ncbi:hypothetical protein [Sphingomonas sp.]|uniref:phage adaptor protein n=1 Tax=Sphingomonas sp. TaxID=28214 RepID=UPI00307EA347
MATFLSLCNDVERESGTVNRAQRMGDVTAPPSDRHEKIVEWVRSAWRTLQTKRQDWRFMTGEVDAPLSIGVARYTPGDLDIDRFADWVRDRDAYRPWTLIEPTVGAQSESALSEISYDHWRTTYGRGVAQQQRPVEYAIARDGAFCVGAVPDKAYVLRGEYLKLPQRLVANGDVPDMPEQYHDAITYRALILMGEHDENPVLISTARAKLSEVYGEMCARLTERVSLATAQGYF